MGNTALAGIPPHVASRVEAIAKETKLEVNEVVAIAIERFAASGCSFSAVVRDLLGTIDAKNAEIDHLNGLLKKADQTSGSFISSGLGGWYLWRNNCTNVEAPTLRELLEKL